VCTTIFFPNYNTQNKTPHLPVSFTPPPRLIVLVLIQGEPDGQGLLLFCLLRRQKKEEGKHPPVILSLRRRSIILNTYDTWLVCVKIYIRGNNLTSGRQRNAHTLSQNKPSSFLAVSRFSRSTWLPTKPVPASLCANLLPRNTKSTAKSRRSISADCTKADRMRSRLHRSESGRPPGRPADLIVSTASMRWTAEEAQEAKEREEQCGHRVAPHS